MINGFARFKEWFCGFEQHYVVIGGTACDLLMNEAKKHLGKPYRFCAKGPRAIDCSGFVSYALRKSGIRNIATDAQGLYKASTPISAADAPIPET